MVKENDPAKNGSQPDKKKTDSNSVRKPATEQATTKELDQWLKERLGPHAWF